MENEFKIGDRVVVTEIMKNDANIGVKAGMRGKVVMVSSCNVRHVMLDGFRGDPSLVDVHDDGSVSFWTNQLEPECPKLTISEAPRLDPSLAIVSADVGTAIEIYREAKMAVRHADAAYMSAGEARVSAYLELDRARDALLTAVDGELVGRAEG